MTGPETIAALAAVLRARAVRVEIQSDGRLYEDGVCCALITSGGRLKITYVRDGVTDLPVRGFGDVVLQLRSVDIARDADRIERRIKERARQAARNDERRTFNQAAE